MSALDPPTCNLALERIQSDFRERILLIVTHDPAVIRRMDETLLMPARAAARTQSASPALTAEGPAATLDL